MHNEDSHRAAHMHPSVWIAAVIIVALVVGILAGVRLAHSNSDYVCSAAVNDSSRGACTGGSWGRWEEVDGVMQRTYTGTRATVTFAGKVNNVSCSHPAYSKEQASGQVTTSYAACQIVQTGTLSSPGGSGSGTAAGAGDVVVSSQTMTTGTTTESRTVSGNYQYFRNAIEDAQAQISITASPSIVHAGDTSVIRWSASHVNRCTVSGDNGDAWPKTTTEVTYEEQTDDDGNTHLARVTRSVTPPALSGEERSSKITQQTVYTLACKTATGRTVTDIVTVTLLPVFQEQ